jgi:hypothetical protein
MWDGEEFVDGGGESCSGWWGVVAPFGGDIDVSIAWGI